MTSIQSTTQNTAITPLMQNMNGTTAATNSAAATGVASGSTTTSSPQSLQDNFMKMLVAQMQYQDPTNPMDSAQMTSQLAQIQTVEGINNLNTSMSTMVKSLNASQAYQASSMIGHTVMIEGNSFPLSKGQGSFGIQLPSSADSVKVNVMNSAGQIVNTINLGAQAGGTIPVAWNGKDSAGNAAPDGNYTFQIAASSGGKPVAATGLAYAGVSGISNTSSGITLNLDNNTTVGVASVVQIL
jgi:flagellar basal-body rod modification protein FlgD